MHTTQPGTFGPNQQQHSPKPGYPISSDMLEQTTNTESKIHAQEFQSQAMMDHGSHPNMMMNVPTYQSGAPVQVMSSLPDVHARSPSKNNRA